MSGQGEEDFQSRRLPSLLGVEAFVAVGRAQSFSRAAENLNLTVSALSKRVASLEAILGEALFIRKGQSLGFTPRGMSLFAELSPLVDELGRILAPPVTREPGLIVLNLPVSLAALWLIPHLAAFERAHPDLRLRLETGPLITRHKRGETDAAIRFGRGEWPDVQALKLADAPLFPVGAAPTAPEAFAALKLLAVQGAEDAWAAWFENRGESAPSAARSPQVFENAHLMLEAAAHGLGLALAPDILTASYLENARLHRISDTPLELGRAYYFTADARRWNERAITALREWLCEIAMPRK